VEEQMAVCRPLIERIGPVVSRHPEGLSAARQMSQTLARYRGRKSLGWAPSRNDQMFFDGKALIFNGVRYHPMHPA
jgi:hypothetical protein